MSASVAMFHPSIPAKIELKEGESLHVEPGSMLAFKNCAMTTSIVAGGIFQRAKQLLFGDRPLLENSFTALAGGGWVILEERFPGQIIKAVLTPNSPPLIIRRAALIASTSNIDFDTNYLGLYGQLEGKGCSALSAQVKKGVGEVHFHIRDGVIKKIPIQKGEPVIIDNDIIVAYEGRLTSKLVQPGTDFRSLFFSGEGLVCQFEGTGIVYVASGGKNSTLVNEHQNRIQELEERIRVLELK